MSPLAHQHVRLTSTGTAITDCGAVNSEAVSEVVMYFAPLCRHRIGRLHNQGTPQVVADRTLSAYLGDIVAQHADETPATRGVILISLGKCIEQAWEEPKCTSQKDL